ncbi:putative peptidoglycan lipid II flippase [Sulfurivirga caldicuralii]|uniref:Probable lipid II flippase MurJ n=1 Tax=Sulfurivirga caldicuralii TaxID=364032 RepID=A0A1N6GKI7_9GAMM|nr:murein biosynthesis integral membrane protein MurJ [Sulfurivirga caldicuralii]SIO08026.1 putative peptidoglycan lipid II flippase [Sulfurivirga caldicuralii]
MLKNLFTVSSMTLVSRILGFVRDMVIARYFGASAGADAFFVAFKIPNFFRRLFAEGAFSQAFVPVLSEAKEKAGMERVRHLVDAISFRLLMALLLVIGIGMVFSDAVIWLFAPGFHAEPFKFQLTAEMLRITFPYLLFISLVALSSAILNTYNHFAVPAFTPVLLNLTLIAAAIGLSPHFDIPVLALAWGVLLAGILQLALHLPFLWRLGLLPRPRPIDDPGVNEVKRLMLPALFGVSVAQINLLIDTVLASFLVTGSVSWLYYADRLMEFPLGVFGIALATVALPGLSRAAARTDWHAYRAQIDTALRLIWLVGVPASLGLMLLAAPLLATLFQYGAFTPEDVMQSSRALMAYALGLVGFMLVKVLAPAFYALKDMKTPVRIAVIALVVNTVLNLVFIFPLAHVGLALATSLAAFVNAGLLYHHLRGTHFERHEGWRALLWRGVLAMGGMVAWLLLWTPSTTDWLSADAWHRIGWLAALVVSAVALYGALLWLLGVRLHHVRLYRGED